MSHKYQKYQKTTPRMTIMIHNGNLVISTDFLCDNFYDAVRRLKLIKRNMKELDRTKPRYKWSEELLHKFALVVTRIGVKTVKPHDIQSEFEGQLSNSQLGSHLQKYKIKIQQENCGRLENWMCPKEFEQYSDVLELLKMHEPECEKNGENEGMKDEVSYDKTQFLATLDFQ